MLLRLTPAQAQKALADEPSPNLSRHCHVGLPGLCEDPAERCQEEEVQEGCCHDADALETRGEEKKNRSGRYALVDCGRNRDRHRRRARCKPACLEWAVLSSCVIAPELLQN